MPISSGASGRPSSSARPHLPAGGLIIIGRNYSGQTERAVSDRTIISRAISASDRALDQENKPRRGRKANTNTTSETRPRASKQMPSDRTDSPCSALRNSKITSEQQYRRIGHTSAPSSNSTTSLLPNKYSGSADDPHLGGQSESDDSNKNNNNSEGQNSSSKHRIQSCDDFERDRANSKSNFATNQQAVASKSNTNLGVFSSLISLGVRHKHKGEPASQRQIQTKSTTTMKRGAISHSARPGLSDAHYTTSASSEAVGQGSLNTPLSQAFNIGGKRIAGANISNPTGRTPSSSATSSTTNLHSLSSLHQQPTTTTINRSFNLKYIKTLIIVLMSLDFLVTIFVHNFASHDEFLIAFTRSKLRLSLVNLISSAVWFVVLSGAILFDVYFVLVIACLVDLASFVILLACSLYHFTNRIDYNLVSMTSLLLLLFSIIILHVYLLVLTALTIYLTLAVKRRKSH